MTTDCCGNRSTHTTQRLIFVIGPTNAGKGCFLETCKAMYPDAVGLVEVGKQMRAKYLDPVSPHYDPDHFKGEAAPASTAVEAWQMMLDGIGANKDCPVVLIDGQPRDIKQCKDILSTYTNAEFVHVYAPVEVRQVRAELRDTGDEAKLALSRARMNTDAIKLYEILTRLINAGQRVHSLNNDGETSMNIFAACVMERTTDTLPVAWHNL